MIDHSQNNTMSPELNHKFVQEATVKEKQDNITILEFANGELLKWPSNLLPSQIKPGQKVRVLIHDKATEEEERRNLAHSLINEIMTV